MNPQRKSFLKFKIDPGLLSRLLMVIVIVFLVAITIWVSGPLPQRDEYGVIITPQPTATTFMQPADNRVAPEILETTPTSGVILASLWVIFIILAGTAISIRSQK